MTTTKTITALPAPLTEFLSPLGMIKHLYGLRNLIVQLTRRQVVAQYKGTYLGLIWSVIDPLVRLCIYTFVFGVIFKARFSSSSDGGNLDFGLNLFCGLIHFTIFAKCVGIAASQIVGNRNYVKKVVFPLEVLPISALGATLVDAAIGMAILIPAILVFSPELSSTAYMYPLVLIPLCSLTLGLSWFLASLGVFLRDIGQFVNVVLGLLIFVSPVFYPVTAVPEKVRWALFLNPLTSILEDARSTLIRGQQPEWWLWLAVTAASLVILQLGYVWFMKSKRAFADVV